MKQTICYIILLMLASSACQHQEVPTYHTDLTQLNIWVGTASGIVYDHVTYNYSYAYEEGAVTFYAEITGMPAHHDRTFQLEVTGPDAETVAPTVRTEEYTIPAGAIGGTFQVHFNTQRLPHADLFTTSDGVVQFRMVQNSDFDIGTENHQVFTVQVKNYLAKPDNWDSVPVRNDMLIFLPLSRYFGSYSRVKYQFMIEHLGLVDFYIQTSMGSLPAYNEETNTISAAYAVQLQQQIQLDLAQYNATHDSPLTDEFGQLVTFSY